MEIKALFLDIGGVLMTNGWDHTLRKKTAEQFGFDYDEATERHRLIFDTFERGMLTFDEYLNQIIFYKKRGFSLSEVKTFIFDAVRPFPDSMDYFKELKKTHGLKVGLVSNEGKELAKDRVRRFHLNDLADFFVISSFVRFRKPDREIYQLAIDIAQLAPEEILYIDDREILIQIANGLKINGIHHKNLEKTKREVENYFIKVG